MASAPAGQHCALWKSATCRGALPAANVPGLWASIAMQSAPCSNPVLFSRWRPRHTLTSSACALAWRACACLRRVNSAALTASVATHTSAFRHMSSEAEADTGERAGRHPRLLDRARADSRTPGHAAGRVGMGRAWGGRAVTVRQHGGNLSGCSALCCSVSRVCVCRPASGLLLLPRLSASTAAALRRLIPWPSITGYAVPTPAHSTHATAIARGVWNICRHDAAEIRPSSAGACSAAAAPLLR